MGEGFTGNLSCYRKRIGAETLLRSRQDVRSALPRRRFSAAGKMSRSALPMKQLRNAARFWIILNTSTDKIYLLIDVFIYYDVDERFDVIWWRPISQVRIHPVRINLVGFPSEDLSAYGRSTPPPWLIEEAGRNNIGLLMYTIFFYITQTFTGLLYLNCHPVVHQWWNGGRSGTSRPLKLN